jgi:hypothetical protein
MWLLIWQRLRPVLVSLAPSDCRVAFLDTEDFSESNHLAIIQAKSKTKIIIAAKNKYSAALTIQSDARQFSEMSGKYRAKNSQRWAFVSGRPVCPTVQMSPITRAPAMETRRTATFRIPLLYYGLSTGINARIALRPHSWSPPPIRWR